ncbi:MAG: diguanylate cyclase, partial [Bacillota bacterium]
MSEIIELMVNESQSSELVSMGVVLKDGSSAFTPIPMDNRDASKYLLPSDWEYIRKTMAGYIGLPESTDRMINGRQVNIYARPIYSGLQTTGALVVLFNSDFFDDLNFPKTFDDGSCSYISDKNGMIIFHPDYCKNKPYADIIKALSGKLSLEGDAGLNMKNAIARGMSGTIEYKKSKEDLYISYVPINFHGWYLINIAPASIAEAQSKRIYDDVIPTFLSISIILIALAIYFIYLKNQNFKRLRNKMQLETINDESYRMIMEQTDDIIFEYDTMDKTYFHTANFKKNFGYEPTSKGFLGSLEVDYVHPDDVVKFVGMYEKMRNEHSLVEAEVRIINSTGEYLWTKVYMIGVYDRDERLAKVIGKIVNIDEKKKELQHLKKMAVMDSATGVYNKQTTEDMIDAFLKGEGQNGRHAMLIVDIDDFKEINDDHGHRLGDAVIAALGLELNHIFRTSDIKGRIGGDEFMILMKDIEGMDFITNKARLICQMFKDRDIDKNKKVPISTSIGIAIYDQDGS